MGAATEIPKTNPFLRKPFETITGADLDEEPYAGFVDDLAQLLADTDMEAVLSDFGKRTARQDPVVHFYETFLAAYDPKLRESRGAYYTPEPVVSYIVRSVDYLLKTRFGCANGLADTSTVEYETDEKRGTGVSPGSGHGQDAHATSGQYFEGIPPEVWNFHIGGYQVCEKWLKDRRGRTLTYDDQMHYCKVATALKETIRLMAEIDAAIPKWPIE